MLYMSHTMLVDHVLENESWGHPKLKDDLHKFRIFWLPISI